jgi:pilus assembly protein CpaD
MEMRTLRRAVLLAPLLAGLAGCYGDYVGDYRERYPIRVQTRPAALPLAFPPGRTELGDMEAARLDSFLADFRTSNSARLAVVANPTGAGDDLARGRARTIEKRALEAGVPASALQTQLLPSPSRPGGVVVSYERSVVEVPECGDWSKNSAIDATNSGSTNFGCATQRYLGLQAADPNDLLRARASDGHDGQRTADVMQKYRTGKQTGAQTPTGQSMSQSFGTGQQ